jgi:hypothetical protein
MALLHDNNFKMVYIIRESPSEEPIAVLRDLRDAYRFSMNRCMETSRSSYSTIKEYHQLEKELMSNVRVTVWYDSTSGLQHTVAKYSVIDC